MVSIPDLSNQGRVAGSVLHGSLDDCQRFFDSRTESGMRQLASPLDLDLRVFPWQPLGLVWIQRTAGTTQGIWTPGSNF